MASKKNRNRFYELETFAEPSFGKISILNLVVITNGKWTRTKVGEFYDQLLAESLCAYLNAWSQRWSSNEPLLDWR
jgi:hypothetical protein